MDSVQIVCTMYIVQRPFLRSTNRTLISSFTSPLADDDYKIVIESFQHIIFVVFHSYSLYRHIDRECVKVRRA